MEGYVRSINTSSLPFRAAVFEGRVVTFGLIGVGNGEICGFQPPNRADILRLTYSKTSEIGMTAKACFANSIWTRADPVPW